MKTLLELNKIILAKDQSKIDEYHYEIIITQEMIRANNCIKDLFAAKNKTTML